MILFDLLLINVVHQNEDIFHFFFSGKNNNPTSTPLAKFKQTIQF